MADENEVEEGGGGKALLVFGILLGVGIGGGLGFMFGGQDTGMPSDATEVEEVEEPLPEPLETVKFDKLAVPVFVKRGGRSRPAGNFLLDVVVHVRGQENVIRVRRADFEMRQAFLIAINKNDVMMEGSTTHIDYKKASSHLKAAAQNILGDKIVNVTIDNAMKVR